MNLTVVCMDFRGAKGHLRALDDYSGSICESLRSAGGDWGWRTVSVRGSRPSAGSE